MDKEEKEHRFELASHYDNIGWLILSFFLFFLSSFIENKNSSTWIEFVAVFFGFIVLRLFLQCQYKRTYYLGIEGSKFSLLLVAILFWIIEYHLIFLLIEDLTNYNISLCSGLLSIIPIIWAFLSAEKIKNLKREPRVKN